jgi:cation:H+ antiporter
VYGPNRGGAYAVPHSVVDAVVRLARRVGLSDLTVGLTVVAADTPTLELAVSLDAAYRGLGDIAVANVLESNVYNITGIVGLAALVVNLAALETLAWLAVVTVLLVAARWTGRVLSRAEGAPFTASEG